MTSLMDFMGCRREGRPSHSSFIRVLPVPCCTRLFCILRHSCSRETSVIVMGSQWRKVVVGYNVLVKRGCLWLSLWLTVRPSGTEPAEWTSHVRDQPYSLILPSSYTQNSNSIVHNHAPSVYMWLSTFRCN